MQDVESLVAEFVTNVDQIASTLIEGFGLLHTGAVDHLNTPLLRWLDFRLRFINPLPRQIHRSDRFPKALDAAAAQALRTIEARITQGEDINLHQGAGLTDFDTSGKKRAVRTDLLWAEWGIHHLHLDLAPHPKRPYFSKRADFLLFAVFGFDYALFIDVLPHRGDDLLFSREELVRVVVRNWPMLLDPFQLKGVLASNPEFTDEQRHELRRSGMDAPLIIDGKTYFAPGGGVTTASTAGRVTESMFRLRRNLRDLAQRVLEPSGEFLAAVPEHNRARSHFALSLSPRGIVILERETNLGWTLPDAKGDGTDSVFAEVSNCLTPAWVKDALLTAHEPSAKAGSDIASDPLVNVQPAPPL
ncbi:hypothetical protein [Paraburkholderia dipogonis]|uniref:hypothetical protein n=1 Tax=Paraburkholderia dipogonis TaxID=1211383 RepID=UPI0038BC08C8